MSTALAALSRYPISGSLEARSSSGPAATTLGAIGTTSAAVGVERRSQFRLRGAGPAFPRPGGWVLPGFGQSACVVPGAPPDVTSAPRDAGAVPLVLPTCCVISH